MHQELDGMVNELNAIDRMNCNDKNGYPDARLLKLKHDRIADLGSQVLGFLESPKGTPIEEIYQFVGQALVPINGVSLNLNSFGQKRECDRLLDRTHRQLESALTATDYFIGLAKGFRWLQDQGAALTFPGIVPYGEEKTAVAMPDKLLPSGFRLCSMYGALSPMLFPGENLKRIKVPNDFYTDEVSPMVLITGENKYGKTNYIKTRGIKQAFFQAGLMVLAKYARMSPVDTILTPMPETHQERLLRMLGRNISGEERERIFEVYPELKKIYSGK